MLSEFAPRRLRGVLLGSLTVMGSIGDVIAGILGTYLGKSEGAAYLLLASGAVPALLVLLLRIGTPESPSWLISQGRAAEARDIARKYLKAELGPAEAAPAERGTGATAAYRELFSPGQARRTWYGTAFYSAQVLPVFAIYTFMPTILAALHVPDPDLQNLLLNLFLLGGGVIGLWFLQKTGRRPLTIVTFGIMTAALTLMGAFAHASTIALMVPFLVYTFVMAGASNLTQVYPAELYPTHFGPPASASSTDEPHRLGHRHVHPAGEPGAPRPERLDVLAGGGPPRRHAGVAGMGPGDARVGDDFGRLRPPREPGVGDGRGGRAPREAGVGDELGRPRARSGPRRYR